MIIRIFFKFIIKLSWIEIYKQLDWRYRQLEIKKIIINKVGPFNNNFPVINCGRCGVFPVLILTDRDKGTIRRMVQERMRSYPLDTYREYSFTFTINKQ